MENVRMVHCKQYNNREKKFSVCLLNTLNVFSMHTHTYTRTHAHTYIHKHTHTYIHTYLHIKKQTIIVQTIKYCGLLLVRWLMCNYIFATSLGENTAPSPTRSMPMQILACFGQIYQPNMSELAFSNSNDCFHCPAHFTTARRMGAGM